MICLCVIQANNSTNTTEDAELEVAFPHRLYTQASKASVSHPEISFFLQLFLEKSVVTAVKKWHECNMWLFISSFQAGERLVFIVQVLKELAKLFKKDHSSASWQKKTEEDFVIVVNGQIHGLRPCVSRAQYWKKYSHPLLQ